MEIEVTFGQIDQTADQFNTITILRRFWKRGALNLTKILE